MKGSLVSSEEIAKAVARFASDKKAEDIVILDMGGIVNYADHFVICTGNNDRHVKAIYEGINEGLAEHGIKIRYKQGLDGPSRSALISSSIPNEAQGMWVLADLGDVVIHIFEPQSREFYGLEHLWQDANCTKFEE